MKLKEILLAVALVLIATAVHARPQFGQAELLNK